MNKATILATGLLGDCELPVMSVESPLAKIEFNQGGLLEPPPSLITFVQQSLRGYTGPERRAVRRYPAVHPAVAVPLNNSMRAAGEPFAAVIRNISTSGLCLFSIRAVSAAFLAVEIRMPFGKPRQVLLKVLRCQPARQFFEVAGELISRPPKR